MLVNSYPWHRSLCPLRLPCWWLPSGTFPIKGGVSFGEDNLRLSMYEGYLKHVHYPNYNLKRCFSQNGGRSRWAQSSPLPSLLPSKQGGGEGGACPRIWSQTATLLSDTGSDFHLLLLKNVKCSLLLAHLRKGALAARPWPSAQQPQPPTLEPVRNGWNQISAGAAGSESADPVLRFHVPASCSRSVARP